MKGAPSRKHLVKDRAKRKDVGTMIYRAAFDLFRRHIVDGAHDLARIGIHPSRGNAGLWLLAVSGAGQLGQAEIENLQASVVGDKEILWFEIAVHDPFFMCGSQAVRDLQGEIDRLARWQGRATDTLSQRLALEQFRD